MKEKIEHYKIEIKKNQSSFECHVSKLKSSKKVMESIDTERKTRSFIQQQEPLTGQVNKIKIFKDPKKPLKRSTILKRDYDGNFYFMKTQDKIWGYLARNHDFMFPFEKQMDFLLKKGETAGYTIGSLPTCDIQIQHINAEPNHAIIYCKPVMIDEKTTLAIYLCNRSSTGTWVNSELIKDQVQLNHNDEIHFFDPKKLNVKENPCYVFVKPTYTTTSMESINDLYLIRSKLGSGRFGVVYLAECKATNQQVAIKYISKEVLNRNSKTKRTLFREITVCMAFPQHPCIIQISRFFERNNDLFIVMEYGKCGDLFDTVNSQGNALKEYEVKIIFDQIAHAVAFLHDHGIVHRDIKLENVIMCDRKNLIVKLCDFGLSTFIKPGKLLNTSCGTMMYAAPELIDCQNGYGLEIDIWSLGVLLFIALVTKTPFHQASNDNEEERELLKQKIIQGEIAFDDTNWSAISNDARDLISNMLTVDKTMRYNIQQVLAHPWLKNIECMETIKAGLKRNPELTQYLQTHCTAKYV